jgi:hypothetical protein
MAELAGIRSELQVVGHVVPLVPCPRHKNACGFTKTQECLHTSTTFPSQVVGLRREALGLNTNETSTLPARIWYANTDASCHSHGWANTQGEQPDGAWTTAQR